jgi:HNH endonuclease
MKTPTCIYCKQKKPIKQFKREHVIPLALGSFKNNPFILRDKVCFDCNQYFGKNLELILGRGSFETLMRITHGIKDFKPIKDDRIEIRYPLKGDFEGAYMRLVGYQERDVFEVELLPQVAFKRKNIEEKVFFKKDKIPSKEELEKEGFNIKELWIYGDKKEREQIAAILKEKEIEYKPMKIKPLSETDEQIKLGKRPFKAIVDNINFRIYAKIAFNYLASIQDVNFVLHDDFDSIRNFIRYDKSFPIKFINIDDSPILFGDQASDPLTDGHLITMEWKNDGPIFAQIKPFNQIKYKIILCANFHGVYRPIHSVHHFNIHSGEISEPNVISHIIRPRYY